MTDFVPSRHGFRFTNSFRGLPVPFSIPGVREPSATYGLCGGMSAAAMDHFRHRATIPRNTAAPAKGTWLYNYLYSRQMTTFGVAGRYILQFISWMVLPTGTLHGTRKRTYDQFSGVRTELNNGRPVILGLVYVSGGSGKVWENHQVLAYGYSRGNNGAATIRIYDPNYPGNDGVEIRAAREVVGRTGLGRNRRDVYGFRCTQVIPGRGSKSVRGFFRIACSPKRPPRPTRS
jgi:hypothetical protein